LKNLRLFSHSKNHSITRVNKPTQNTRYPLIGASQFWGNNKLYFGFGRFFCPAFIKSFSLFREMGNKGGKIDPTAEYYQLLVDSTISGETWKDLLENLKKHVENKKAIEREWLKLAEKDNENSVCMDLFGSAASSVNKDKNRYLNILPLESTRVKLELKEGVVGSDYINANFVNTENRMYICCQAPLEETIEDFYRMLWQSNCSIVVMLTKYMEDGMVKATQYLPDVNEDPIKYGPFHVEVTSEEPMNNNDYVLRKFILKKNTERRTITQFHFLAWPDHDVPKEPKGLLDMIVQVNKLEDSQEKRVPTVVHCSAGIGRTGTYVIINSILESISEAMKNENTKPSPINLMKALHSYRKMRSGLVNHVDQYYFCYNSIIGYIEELLKNNVKN